MNLNWTLWALLLSVVSFSGVKSTNQNLAVPEPGTKVSVSQDQHLHNHVNSSSGNVASGSIEPDNRTSPVSSEDLLNGFLDQLHEESRATEHVGQPLSYAHLPYSNYVPRPTGYHPSALPASTYGQSLPSYNPAGPNYGHPTSIYGHPGSSYGHPAPSYGHPASSYARPGPSYGPPAPSYNPEASYASQSYRKPTVDISLVKPVSSKIVSKPSGLGGLMMSLLGGGGGLQLDGIKDLVINGILKPLLVAKGGIKSLIGKLLVPFLVLVLINIEVLAVVWWLWEDCPEQPMMIPLPPPAPSPPPSYPSYPNPNPYSSYPKAAYDMYM